MRGVVLGFLVLAGCAETAAEPARPDATATLPDAKIAIAFDAPTACAVSGAPGICIEVADCTDNHSAFSGHCPGPADIQCCIVTPDVADNPPSPVGYRLMLQAEVTPEMTDWAVAILQDADTYPMFATATMTFGDLPVLARVEWHPPDFQNAAVHRGVTLYTPT